MAAISEYPELAKSIFLTQEKNDVGIYAVKFYIRGKPWVVTVDDNVMMYSNAPNFALIGDNDALWVPILQKAWAKVKGTYSDANLGF
jgi:calpain-15